MRKPLSRSRAGSGSAPRALTRAMAVHDMRARLLREGFPRIQMFILVSLTALAGFGASVALLAAGMDTMALRYLLSVGVAYVVFLLLLWLWLHTSAADYLDVATSGGTGGDTGTAHGPAGFSGGGGSFDGGGASANVDFSASDSGIGAIAEKPLEAIGQAEEAALPLAVLLLVLGIALSSLFVIWSAPVLFAEILVDALLAAGLYRRLRLLDQRHWMVAALRHTAIPFLLTALVAAGAGWGMQQYAPAAASLGQVLSGR
ncbi:hypothetical protein [Massilia sp. YIM B02443]|uniref:hypothetical protein n=1 Tax=Massilia sp. YIM B02443 TaxID=3050127 RepID=UPI0025B720C0|nr:hypothetical protein [Massilia sp. YIM B02443]MDN4037715.1 hypothetical protein [Massilia sp. YIM B02443]